MANVMTRQGPYFTFHIICISIYSVCILKHLSCSDCGSINDIALSQLAPTLGTKKNMCATDSIDVIVGTVVG